MLCRYDLASFFEWLLLNEKRGKKEVSSLAPQKFKIIICIFRKLSIALESERRRMF